jgi:predicted nucleic acid-binding protein
MTYLLDTSIFIALLRRKQAAYDIFQSLRGQKTTSTVCIGELYEGVYKSEQKESNKEKLEKLLEELTTIISFSQKEALAFGKLKAAMKRELIPDMDLQIAATCIVHDCTLVTFDKHHFPKVPGLKILT